MQAQQKQIVTRILFSLAMSLLSVALVSQMVNGLGTINIFKHRYPYYGSYGYYGPWGQGGWGGYGGGINIGGYGYGRR